MHRLRQGRGNTQRWTIVWAEGKGSGARQRRQRRAPLPKGTLELESLRARTSVHRLGFPGASLRSACLLYTSPSPRD
eukprot:1604354-Alexandrium_andersonii.AAC.1